MLIDPHHSYSFVDDICRCHANVDLLPCFLLDSGNPWMANVGYGGGLRRLLCDGQTQGHLRCMSNQHSHKKSLFLVAPSATLSSYFYTR